MRPNLSRLTAPGKDVRRGISLLALAFAFSLTLLGLAGLAGQAVAAGPSGSYAATLGYGPSGQALKRAGVRISAVAPSTQTKLSGGRVRINSTLSGLDEALDFTLRGGMRFTKGKRSLVLRQLKVSRQQGRITATVAGRRIAFFLADFTSQVDEAAGTMKITGGRLRLTAGSARLIRSKLRIGRLPAAQVGGFSADATFAFEDPYFQQCGLSASSEIAGTLPGAAPLPVLNDSRATVGSGVTWGFRTAFRSYIHFGAGGSLQALGGAVSNQVGPFPESFTWPNAPGQYTANDPIDMTDDQAVINGTGDVLFCANPHGFRVVISDPTVVINGSEGRIIADVDANFNGKWIPSQRIDFAELDLTGITPFYNRSGAEVTWSDVPVTLTESGANSICGSGDAPVCGYAAGDQLDPITVESRTAYDTSDLSAGGALDTYVTTNLPFPISDPAQGGCTLAPPAADGRLTIDSALAANPNAPPKWNGTPANAAPEPVLSGGVALTGGGLDWGLRASLRGSVNATGLFNLSPGVTATHTYVGTGAGSVAPPVALGPGPNRQMTNAVDRFFKWPAAPGSTGAYDAGGPGDADDRLVLRTEGRVAFCQTEVNQSYGAVLANPTVVIDGADSRLTIDVATRYRSSWVRGRVDFASLDLAGISVNSVIDSGTKTVSWTFPEAAGSPAVGPVELTSDGEQVINMLAKGTYVAGLGLAGATVRASFPE